MSCKSCFVFLIQLSLDTALKLQIPEEHEDGQQMRYYSLEDLRELQNKLMLMSGKGDQGQNEVDRFAEVNVPDIHTPFCYVQCTAIC